MWQGIFLSGVTLIGGGTPPKPSDALQCWDLVLTETITNEKGDPVAQVITLVDSWCDLEGGSAGLDPNPIPFIYHYPRFIAGASTVVTPNRILRSVSTNAANFKLSFQVSEQSTITLGYEISATFQSFGAKLNNTYSTTHSWTLNGEYTTPSEGYWVFNAEEEVINDYYDIIEVFQLGPFHSESVVATAQLAQKQNKINYIIYKNGQKL